MGAVIQEMAGPRLQAGRIELESHALVKNLGEPVVINWPVANFGDETGQARLILAAFPGGVVAAPPPVAVPPTESATPVSINWPVDLPEGATTNVTVSLTDVSGGVSVTLDSHDFTITVPAPEATGPILTPAVPSPSIT